MSVGAIVAAAGSGIRLGGGVPKAFRCLDGISMLERSVTLLAEHVDRIVVVVPPELVTDAQARLAEVAVPLVVVAGGALRQDSVAAGLQILTDDVVLVHDAARPLMPGSVVVAVLSALTSGAVAVVPVLPVSDTLKVVHDGIVRATVDRSTLAAVQTPQGFRHDVLTRAHALAGPAATDDAGLVEALGIAVATVPGHPAGFKITTAWDVEVAEALLAAQR